MDCKKAEACVVDSAELMFSSIENKRNAPPVEAKVA
jgi:hypothetical protein